MTDVRPTMILFSHYSHGTFITGAEKLLLLFARELQALYRCVLVVPREGMMAARARALGIETAVMDIPLCVSLYSAVHTLPAELHALKRQPVYHRLLAFLMNMNPQCVFVNTCVHPLPALAASHLGIPTVWSLMETIQRTSERHLSVSVIASASDLILGISRTTLTPFHGHPAEAKSAVLSPYLDLAAFEPETWPMQRVQFRARYGWDEGQRVIGFITAAIYREKGLESFVHAAIRTAHTCPDTRFLVVGKPTDDAHYRHCRALAAGADLEGRFAWVPFVESVQQVFPAMDIVVVPSLMQEGFGMTALEGMLFGKPVVAFASGGLAEILSETGNERFLVRTGDTAGLAAAIHGLLADDSLRMAVGSRNVQAAQAAFGVEAFRARLEPLLQRIPVRQGFRTPLARARGRSRIYLIVDGRRRPFISQSAFLQRGFRFEHVRETDWAELRAVPRGEPIGAESRRPAVAARRGRRSAAGGKRSGRRARKAVSVSRRLSRRRGRPARPARPVRRRAAVRRGSSPRRRVKR